MCNQRVGTCCSSHCCRPSPGGVVVLCDAKAAASKEPQKEDAEDNCDPRSHYRRRSTKYRGRLGVGGISDVGVVVTN